MQSLFPKFFWFFRRKIQVIFWWLMIQRKTIPNTHRWISEKLQRIKVPNFVKMFPFGKRLKHELFIRISEAKRKFKIIYPIHRKQQTWFLWDPFLNKDKQMIYWKNFTLIRKIRKDPQKYYRPREKFDIFSAESDFKKKTNLIISSYKKNRHQNVSFVRVALCS